ncbi:hypothetical protein [Bradyrhizobium sp. JYMT SZCCT0428]|uniref:hypothetical protein n=1 Tax=Bradyrhizobium sp. JYMT SZCCT0428 TaxID=2807673 RepID=UPI001BA74B4B|nr:hypothetical protein [Bradyrhizobium sp. JYMT SZCCT0428]MBR1149700.1 hypothetical protein [Bradyrhizobium sp. JYMT SZCCT0428]
MTFPAHHRDSWAKPSWFVFEDRNDGLSNLPLSSVNQSLQDELKRELQEDSNARKFEHLAAALIGRLLDVPIAVAKSGFQHGGDAGPAGQHGRRFRLECKKYSDTTSLGERELLGELDQALGRDYALEGWFLAATRSVPEQLSQSLMQKGEQLGIPVIVIDWNDRDVAPLAALCALAPDVVEAEFSKDAAMLARALQPAATDAIDALRRNLQSWSLGFQGLRAQSHDKLKKIWTLPKTSNAELGQDAAGGAQSKKVKRKSVSDALSAWWQGPAQRDAPAAIVGSDGVGKTWAALDWLVDHRSEHPIILVVSSSAAANITAASEMEIKSFLAERLYELTGVRDTHHWMRRLGFLLKRPTTEGAVLTVLFDGLNQEPSVQWLSILKVLQSEVFAGRVRVMVSTRPHHFQDKLANLRGLIVPAVRIGVDVYDATPGAELDQMLAFEGLSRADLHPDLIELARTPRFFKLVVRFRDRLVDAGQVTIHRLLWEYGRDSFGHRAGKSFSEEEWHAWLQEIARRYRDGMTAFSVKTLSETTSRPDLSAREVYLRLSDIIDGQFAKPGPAGGMQLTPTVVAHALGAGLLAQIDGIGVQNFESVDAVITSWLDPIAGLDQRAEILRAAVSILVEREGPTSTPASGVLVTAWLQSQNVTDSHRRELAGLSIYLAEALLDAVQRSNARSQASARLWAVNALRAIPRTDRTNLTIIVARTSTWLSIVSRELDPRLDANPDSEKSRSNRYKTKIGVDASGELTVLGVPLTLVDRDDGSLASTIPSILEGFPLAGASSCFEAAAISRAVNPNDEVWRGLKWLCYLNELDPRATAVELRTLSGLVRTRVPEPGIHADLSARAGSLLLRLTGEEVDEDSATSIDTDFDHQLTYQKDYLASPSRSFFALERRHADLALSDTGVGIATRVQRASAFWSDPSFKPQQAFVNELRAAALMFDVGTLDSGGSFTREDHVFESLEPALAACAPDILAELTQRKLLSFKTRPPESRYWSAVHAVEHYLLAGQTEAEAAQILRLSAVAGDSGEEAVAAGRLLMLELRSLDTVEQFNRMIAAALKFVSTEFEYVLNAPTPDQADALISQHRHGTKQEQHDLLLLLSVHSVAFSDKAWTWFEELARDTNHELRGIVFRMLEECDAPRFGRILVGEGWTWAADADFWVNHYGSGALIASETALPFDQLAPRLAPWRLLEAARARGADVAEVRLAAEIFGQILAAPQLEEPDPGSDLSVERSDKRARPFVLSAEPRANLEVNTDPFGWLKVNADAVVEAHRRAIDTAVERIEVARKAGASLYLTDVSAEDMDVVSRHAGDMLDRWLEGGRERTNDFRRRVRLAEAAYLALCESLLRHDPGRGADLWHALRATLATRYVGAAGIDELLHIVFRVPDSPPAILLRDGLLDLENCYSDLTLFELALAASYNGKTHWVTDALERDRASSLIWRRMRAVILEGFVIGNALPAESAWPSGPITNWANIRRKSALRRGSDACARHWWRAYLIARNPVEAYAAWILFRDTADRRAWVWMQEEVQALDDGSQFFDLKLKHAKLNYAEVKRAMEKRLKKLDGKFLDQDVVQGVGPWGKRRV